MQWSFLRLPSDSSGKHQESYVFPSAPGFMPFLPGYGHHGHPGLNLDPPCGVYDFRQDTPSFRASAHLLEDLERKAQRAAHRAVTSTQWDKVCQVPIPAPPPGYREPPYSYAAAVLHPYRNTNPLANYAHFSSEIISDIWSTSLHL